MIEALILLEGCLEIFRVVKYSELGATFLTVGDLFLAEQSVKVK
jgi:hypothetical protein